VEHITTILKKKKPALSFEFFPPKTEEGAAALFQTMKNLTPLKPAYVSVTYGAGGTTRTLTQDLVLRIQKETNMTVVAHLTCVGASKDELYEVLSSFWNSGIRNIMALRGDPPKGTAIFKPNKHGFSFAVELVRFIRKEFPDMGIGVAGFPEGHPEMPNRLLEMDYLKEKIDAGADYMCTQLFFDNRDYYDFMSRCRLIGIKVPIIAGIMPCTSKSGIKRMAELALGARIPAPLMRALNRAKTDEAVQQVGSHWATEQVRDLLEHNVAGIHFYTLNKSTATRDIYMSLGVGDSDSLQYHLR